MPNKEESAEECDATEVDSSNAVKYITISGAEQKSLMQK